MTLKITFIGAGSFEFGLDLILDIITFPALRKNTLICLEDIDESRLDLMYRIMLRYKEQYPEVFEGVSFEKTTNLKKALVDAKYILCAIRSGGFKAFKLDIDIPAKYGVTQCVGDTLGPGGIFRFLRTAPDIVEIAKIIHNEGYNAANDCDKPFFLNYTNPMAMLTWYCNSVVPDSMIGLCHGVQHTSFILASLLGIKQQEVSYLCAGINHMAWFLEYLIKKNRDGSEEWIDAYPLIRKRIKENPEKMKRDKLRWDMMLATGYFMTESSGHLSEYLPYYRKRNDLLDKYSDSAALFGSLKHRLIYDLDSKRAETVERNFARYLKKKKMKIKQGASEEYAAYIINARETNVPFRFNGNIINKEQSLITNLPKGCCVEVPIFIDSHGIHPQGGIELPTICQALCISNIMVQKAAVEALLEKDREKVYHAVLLDPNTASVCSPQEVRHMVDELFEAQKEWLPNFN